MSVYSEKFILILSLWSYLLTPKHLSIFFLYIWDLFLSDNVVEIVCSPIFIWFSSSLGPWQITHPSPSELCASRWWARANKMWKEGTCVSSRLRQWIGTQDFLVTFLPCHGECRDLTLRWNSLKFKATWIIVSLYGAQLQRRMAGTHCQTLRRLCLSISVPGRWACCLCSTNLA